MQSLILQTSSRYLKPLLLVFSIILLYRGHNMPGGGFVGGLMAGSAYVLHAIAFSIEDTYRAIKLDPRTYAGIGLLIAVSSGLLSLFSQKTFMTGLWVDFELPLHIHIHQGTPALFDIGVYFVVFGVTLTIILGLMEEE